jgi:hypothetical protein
MLRARKQTRSTNRVSALTSGTNMGWPLSATNPETPSPKVRERAWVRSSGKPKAALTTSRPLVSSSKCRE